MRVTARIGLLLLVLTSLPVLVACGGGDPEGEATWETHTTAPDDSAGGEDEGEAPTE